jgi:DNA-binding SARP family transcriptional activator
MAAQAFEEAARLGHPDAPLLREREVATSLLALAATTGSPAATSLDATSLPIGLFLLGRFELTRGGRLVAMRAGQSAQLLKLIAVRGRVPVEQAIEALWPEVDPVAGRNRLRTVLGRLREVVPEVHRDGDVLRLDPAIRVDLTEFDREARQALALGGSNAGAALAVASSAVARYRGDLLPNDLYEDWAYGPRSAARQTMLDILDLCAEITAARGDLDEARRWVQRTIEFDPHERDRYLRAAEILSEQGRRAAALSVLDRARVTLATLGLDLPPQPLESEVSLAG